MGARVLPGFFSKEENNANRSCGCYTMSALLPLTSLISPRRWKYRWQYLCGRTPWETGQTPFEVIEFIDTHSPGKALELGCGTGTHCLTLARHGWAVTGIDDVATAIRRASKKAAGHGLPVSFVHADVTRPLSLGGHFDYALDIGCLFALDDHERRRYAANLARLLKPGACYMLYAWLPWVKNGKPRGISPETVETVLGHGFARYRMTVGEEKGRPSAWYWYRRKDQD